jgi:GH15 family glucan-1,4-alpha-glucosidase
MPETASPQETPIADHGMIGDLRSVALVSLRGTIDWFCPERFDAPSVFAGILDNERGGSWEIVPSDDGTPRTTQFYFPDSNVLVTRLMNEDGVVELQDFMPVGEGQRIIRRVNCVRGEMRLHSVLAPRFDYGRSTDQAAAQQGDAVVMSDGGPTLTLTAGVPLEIRDRDVHADLELSEGETVTLVLHVGDVVSEHCHDPEVARQLFEETVSYWRDWLHSSTYTGRWREMVQRSALTLKLLTYEPTGAIVAAPTTSLPEMIGGSRNWDYRYVWMRDAAFSVYALIRLGFTEEAAAFSRWTSERIAERSGDGTDPLQVMYRLDGGTDLPEEELDNLRGHAGSRPVRIGNGAVDQRQLDIYGELIDSIYLYDKYGEPISHDTWMDLTGIVDWLCEHWDEPDSGIWEERSEPRNHTFSRLMSWVALERVIRMARKRGLPADIGRWSRARDDIYMQIMEQGFSSEANAFVGHLGHEDMLDASLLLMPMVKFCSPMDPRFVSTLEAIEANLVADTLVYRYDPANASDGIDGQEGTFSICSFWYVEALTRVGRLADARLALEKMFTYANHLGLYAEEISATGEQRGNFPQAFTHFALISAAYNLDRALNAR